MKAGHIHLNVKDLPAAVKWLREILRVEPTYQDDRMASIPFEEMAIILDVAPADSVATFGFESKNCDADFQEMRSRGAVVLQEPKDQPWGARSAYLQGPGAIRFEIEQMLPRAQ